MRKMIIGFALFIVMMLVFVMPALAASATLYIDTEHVYPDMGKSYADGYVPSVQNGNAVFVLPLMSNDIAVKDITVTPVIGTDAATPFSYGNYEFNVAADADGVFLIKLALPLKADRQNGAYPVTFKVRFTDGAGNEKTQEFPVYLTVSDGIDPDAPDASPAPVIAGKLFIDSNTLYTGMEKTYAQGYMPLINNGAAYIVLPLLGGTYDGRVTVTAQLGAVLNSPFVYGNYTQTATGMGRYVFALEIPLSKNRYNGSYPVELKASYIDITGANAEQSFTVYVTVTDGKRPPDPNAIVKTEAEKPELYISACSIDPLTVGGDEPFTVSVSIRNIGNIRARSVKLCWGSETEGILPADVNNSMLLENIASGEAAEASFELRTTKDVLAGNRSFFITLDYIDLYGGIYTGTREFLINVTQPAEMTYDAITVPKSITAGETMTLPANVFNVGKAVLRNVSVTVTGAGLFPVSSVFLGDIPPGSAGTGELKVFAGMLSMTEGYTQSYGTTNGRYTITYSDDADVEHTVDVDFTMEIKQPVIEAEKADAKLTEEPVFQWWAAVLVGFAVIAVIVTVIILSRFGRMLKLK